MRNKESNRKHQQDFVDRMESQGLIRVKLWIPAEDKKTFENFARFKRMEAVSTKGI